MNSFTDHANPPGARIKVIGVGGGGGNAINTMIRSGLEGVEFIAANTDVQSLRFSLAPTRIQMGKELTKGLGAGADPDIGRDAALEDRHQIQDALKDADMVFITAGMGGGTGTGAAAIIAQIARELGALSVAVVTKPFDFEGKRRLHNAIAGIDHLRDTVDTLITIPNQRLLQIATPKLTMIEAFAMADNVLVNAVKGISDIINVPGTVNVDFADVKTVMSSMGHALMGIGSATGESRAAMAAKQAISSPLLEDIDIEGATGILINITASSNLSLLEVSEACSVIQEAAHEDANIIFGSVIDESMGDLIRITVIATGFPADRDESVHEGDRRDSHRMLISKNDLVVHKGKSAPYLTRQSLITPKKPQVSSTLPLTSTPIVTKAPVTPTPTPEIGLDDHDENLSEAAIGLKSSISINNEMFIGKQKFAEETNPAQHSSSTYSEQHSAVLKGPSVDYSNASEILNHELMIPLNLDTKEDENLSTGDANITAREGAQAFPTNSMDFSHDFSNIDAEISKTIDDALKISERLKSGGASSKGSDDNIDIPTFIRQGIRDLNID